MSEGVNSGSKAITGRMMLPFACMSASYFAHIGFFNPYLSLWLKELGYGVSVIGLLISFQAFTRLYSPYAWGWISDRTGHRVLLLRISAGVALLCSLGLGHQGGLAWLVAVLFTPYLGVKLLPDFGKLHPHHDPDEIYNTPNYQRLRAIVTWAVDHRYKVIGGVIGIFLLACLGFVVVQKQFFPYAERLELFIQIQSPEGSSITASQREIGRAHV
mgnify:CR=1 FL=1